MGESQVSRLRESALISCRKRIDTARAIADGWSPTRLAILDVEKSELEGKVAKLQSEIEAENPPQKET